MRRKLFAVLSAAVLMLCGCSQKPAESSVAETLPPMTEAPKPAVVYYVTDHGTAPLDKVTKFKAAVEAKNCLVQADAMAELPTGADLVILNAPREDLTKEEAAQLDRYMDDGGHLLLLIPADENDTRYKYLERSLERFCIRMDYDRIVETDKARMQGEDPTFPEIRQVHAPEGMTITDETAQRPLYLHNCRSFHFETGENFHDLRLDAILETAASAVGEPCGGVADDPLTFEHEQLMTMLFSRDTMHGNGFMVVGGASDFLLDENYDLTSSTSAQDYVLAAVGWAANPVGF